MIIISTNEAPSAIGPYSQAIAAGDYLYTSGQIPLSAATGKIVGDNIEDQARQMLDNLRAVVSAAGCTLDKVIKTTCFLADMADFADFNKVYGEYFVNTKPARSCIAVKTLPRNVLCEVEAVVYIR